MLLGSRRKTPHEISPVFMRDLYGRQGLDALDKVHKFTSSHTEAMRNNPTAILALFARGREIGFVIIENGELWRYGVKTIKGKRRGVAFAKRVESAISPLMEAIGPHGVIVIERTESLKREGALCHILPQLLKGLTNRGYSLHSISLAEVKQRLCDTRKATHRELIEAIAERYPVLRSVMIDAKAQKVKYWEKVFIAMALADGAKSTCPQVHRGRQRTSAQPPGGF